VRNSDSYPVIDLFAGPGGLGEGFASLRQPNERHNYAFRTGISIEKDSYAHKTLELRHFYREFPPDAAPDDYYYYLEGRISLEELYLLHPQEASLAQQTAWRCTLGEEPDSNVKKRISQAIDSQKKMGLSWWPTMSGIFAGGSFKNERESRVRV
jgi:DNA (cytosine-5)-methyltransferase 1